MNAIEDGRTGGDSSARIAILEIALQEACIERDQAKREVELLQAEVRSLREWLAMDHRPYYST